MIITTVGFHFRPSAFQAGYTLIHLAIRFQREDILTILLTATDVVKKTKKRVPSHIAPDLASDILRDVSIGIRQRKGDFPCYFLTDMASFALPAGKKYPKSLLLYSLSDKYHKFIKVTKKKQQKHKWEKVWDMASIDLPVC